MGVAFFSSILPHNQISRRVLWCCVVVSVVLQCAGMLLVQAWKWPLPALAGALFVIQYLSCYLAGLIQRDIQDEKLDDKFLLRVSSVLDTGSSDRSWMVFYEWILLIADYPDDTKKDDELKCKKTKNITHRRLILLFDGVILLTTA